MYKDIYIDILQQFIGKPLNILIICLIIYLTSQYCNYKIGKITFIVWFIYFISESLIKIFTPESNIRVDLIIIGPILIIVSILYIFCILF
jgi:hypothetical protein